MGNIIKLKNSGINVYELKLRQLEYLERQIPRSIARKKKLKEILAPRCIIDNEVRILLTYKRRYARLKRWANSWIGYLDEILDYARG